MRNREQYQQRADTDELYALSAAQRAKIAALSSESPNVAWAVNGGNLGPATTVELTAAPTLSKRGSGLVLVTGSLSGVQNAAENVTIDLYRDFGTPGATVLAQAVVPPAPGGGFNFGDSLSVVDVLPDSAPHAYSIVASSDGVHTITVAAKQATITAYELGT